MAGRDRKANKKRGKKGAKGGVSKAADTARGARTATGGVAGPKLLTVFFAFAAIGLVLYAPALGGDFISDDEHYVLNNPYVHDPVDAANFVAIWDPSSVVTVLVENYAPVHLMLHGIEWQFFGTGVTGYHVVNVLLHALASALLALLFLRSGLPRAPALFGAALFLVHPANVESVAWISQLKSSSALVLTLTAVLAHPRRPLLALVAFTFALFAKPFAAVALPVVLMFGWSRTYPGTAGSPAGEGATETNWAWAWLGGWAVSLAFFAWVESIAFAATAGNAPTLYADLGVRILMIFSVALRYVVMAVSGLGLSAFHEPAPVESVADPWFVCSVIVLALLAIRFVHCLRSRREEAVYWAWAAISFAPLSGVVPLPFPMADRYLYFILPGLIGGSLFAGLDLVQRFEGRLAQIGPPAIQRRVAAAAGAIVLLAFGGLAFARAGVWQSAERLMADTEKNYPDGAAANTRKAGRASRRGDFEAAVGFLRLAYARGYNRLDHLLIDPSYRPMQSYAPFVELKNEMAGEWIDRLGRNDAPSHVEARALAQAYIVLEDYSQAIEVLRSAAGRPGPLSSDLEKDAVMVQGLLDQQRRFRELREGAS